MLARTALYSGSLGVSTSPAILSERPESEEMAISKLLELAYENQDEDRILKVYAQKIKDVLARKAKRRADKKNPRKREQEMKEVGRMDSDMDMKKADVSGGMLGSIPNLRKHRTITANVR
jgi:hypothetical protein